jgi:hypothetical protein
MAAQMLGANLRHILGLMPCICRPMAKIHIFEPHGMEILVKAAQAFPHIATGHEECARRLLHRTFAIQIPIQVSIAAVCRIVRPQAVDSQELECQGSCRGKTADGEPGLRSAVGSGQLARGESVFPACLDQRRQRSPQPDIGIQQQNRIADGCSETLICGSGEPAILQVGE